MLLISSSRSPPPPPRCWAASIWDHITRLTGLETRHLQERIPPPPPNPYRPVNCSQNAERCWYSTAERSLYLSGHLSKLMALGLWVSILLSSLSSCSALVLMHTSSGNLISLPHFISCLSLSLCVFVLFCAEETGVDISHLDPCSV